MKAHAGPCTRLHSAGAEVVAVDPAARELQASSAHPSMQREGRTAIASSAHAHLEWVNAQVVLLMACKLIHYRPVDASYDAWLGRITKLVTAAKEAHALSRLLCLLYLVTGRKLREHRQLLLRMATRLRPERYTPK
ncbi:hypothetical protein D1007_40135 [Hordeum vulgare]|nr:hypothetical protein D1007_40135 [Hordeum vulgare]